MFENRRIKTKFGEVDISRIIASWHNVGGITNVYLIESETFIKWLKEIGVSEEDIVLILEYANDVIIELEDSAKDFIKKTHIDLF